MYALLECARFKRIQQAAATFYVKAILVIVGFVSSIATYLSGEAIEDLFRGNARIDRLIEAHSTFALATVIVFGILAISYKLQWIKRDTRIQWLQKLYPLSDFILRPVVCIPLAIIGLGLVTVTGALGGSIVYGPNIDPFVGFIYRMVVGT